MKRAFRVATVFTGAAACVAGVTPAAQAAAAAPGVAVRVMPDATGRSCAAGGITMESHGLVLYYDKNVNPHPPACFTGTGYAGVGGHPRFSSYCADGAVGDLLINGTWEPFTSGRHHLYGQVVSSVYIQAGPAAHACGA